MLDRIIFVDDQRAILESLKWLFIDEPCQIEVFDSPSEALSLPENPKPAVIVSDQWMTEMTGIELLQQVKNKWPNTIRIIMTIDPDKTVIDALSQGNIYGIIQKPWSTTELKQVIRSAVDRYQSH